MNNSKKESCKCKEYSHLELSREIISNRIKETKEIKKNLEYLAKSETGNHLYKCKYCNQLWQLSSAWNWGGKDYVFKIPKIEIEEWKKEPFMSPAEMIIFSALMKSYFERTELKESENLCKRESCENKAILKDVLCKKHLIESLQKIGNLPQKPEGKIFEPYKFE